MSDDRKFATAKMNKPKDSAGEVILLAKRFDRVIESSEQFKKKYNFRKLLYIVYIPLLIIDWIVTLLANIIELICNSIKEVALHLETYINNADSKSSEPET